MYYYHRSFKLCTRLVRHPVIMAKEMRESLADVIKIHYFGFCSINYMGSYLLTKAMSVLFLESVKLISQ